jgi:hypothetical protein
MGHHSCCNQQKVKRGLWSPEEDEKLITYITTHGYGCWSEVPDKAGTSYPFSFSFIKNNSYILFLLLIMTIKYIYKFCVSLNNLNIVYIIQYMMI